MVLNEEKKEKKPVATIFQRECKIHVLNLVRKGRSLEAPDILFKGNSTNGTLIIIFIGSPTPSQSTIILYASKLKMYAPIFIFCTIIAVECFLSVPACWQCVHTEYDNCSTKAEEFFFCQGDTDRVTKLSHTNNIIDLSLKCKTQLTTVLNVVWHSHQLTLCEAWKCLVTTLQPFLCCSS